MTSVTIRTCQTPSTRFPVSGMRDEELIRSFVDRREGTGGRAFAELVQRHGPMVLGICRHLLRDPHDAEDAFQATFLVLARKAGSIERPELLAHWLQGVAIRVARQARGQNDRRRRIEGREVATLDPEPIGDPGLPEQRLVRREAAQAIHEELARLPEIYRSPVVLCDLDGLTHAEAAGRLDWPVGSLSVRLMRARNLLRERLGRRGLAPSLRLAPREAGPTDVPRTLARKTVRAAFLFAQGQPASTSAGHLASQALATMTVVRSSTVLAFSAIFGMAIFVATMLAQGADDPHRANNPGSVRSQPDPAVPPPAEPTTGKALPVEDQGPRQPVRSGQPIASRPEPTKQGEVAQAYAVLAQQSGRDAEAQFRLALWCEEHGLTAERLHHLTLAILRDPAHPGARGLSGQVQYGGRWRSAGDVAPLVLKDEEFVDALEAYHERRDKTAPTADAQWRLAIWCEQKGLKDEATAHLVAVTRLAPDHELARKRLGFKKLNGRWTTPDQIAAEQAEANARKEGNARWRPLLIRWKAWLDDPKHRREAEEGLLGLDDPDAVPSVWAVFASARATDQARAVQLLGQIDAPSSTFGLAVLAVFSDSEPVRRASAETLAHRDPRDAVGLMVGLLLDPEPNPNTPIYRFECLPIGALGYGSPGITWVEGRKSNAVQVYTVDESIAPGGFNWSFDWSGYERRVEKQRQRQIRQLEATIGDFIADAVREVGPIRLAAQQFNGRVIGTLRNITGRDRGGDWEAWKRWWVESQGYAYDPEPFHNPVDLALFDPKPTYVATFHLSCFGAGTPVQTLTGPRPIESIRVGDRVLTQDVRQGQLEYAAVQAVFHNRPAETLQVNLGDGSIITTGIHRFWLAGKGWEMARDLKPGDVVRTLDGTARVRSVAPNPIQPVYNLEVGKGRTFFAGQPAALVHDNSRVEHVARPFDALDNVEPRPGRSIARDRVEIGH